MADELREYRRKRKADRTPEPGVEKDEAGRAGAGRGARFVVDWHSASRLHYDLRLEIDGVAKSWAIPKGPPVRAGVKRLAVQTEDHPLEYLEWEGDIPAGEYGGGKMRIWDRGTFELEERSARELKLVFHGEKLSGAYVLIKTKGEKDWLFMQHRRSDPLAGKAGGGGRSGLGHSGDVTVHGPQALPEFRPMLASGGDNKPFDHPEWSFEIKWDGVRTIAFVAENEVLLRSRTGRGVTATYPELGSLHRNVKAPEAVLDGEIVALDETGRSNFQLLQSRVNRRDGGGRGAVPIVYYVFDLLWVDGRDLTSLPWEERRERLAAVLEPDDRVRLSEAVTGEGKALYAAAVAQGVEGVMAKRRDSPYCPGLRSAHWLKIKQRETGEFVVGGYTRGRGSRGASFGALLLGRHDEDGGLRYVGHTGTGFTDEGLREAVARLKPLERTTSPFATKPKVNQPPSWVEPELRCRVEFANWTRDGRLRAPSFKGWVAEEPALPELKLSNLTKPYWPKEGYTKGDLIDYYRGVAGHLLPHLAGRPMVMNRFPDGWAGKSFYQKDAPAHRPDWVETVRLPADEGRKKIDYVLCPDERHLLWLANLGCIEMNPWLSRLPDLASPTQILFDLDPHPPADFTDAVRVALLLAPVLEQLGLEGFPKTSGGKGMHIMVPIEPGLSYEFVRLFAEGVARGLERANPKLITTEQSKSRRGRRVLVDFRQNRQGSTISSVYSPRPRAGAPISTPLRWDEVTLDLDPARFSFAAVLARCRDEGDLFAPVLSLRQEMAPAVERLPAVDYAS